MEFEGICQSVVRELHFSWGITRHITPKSRLTEDLGLDENSILDDLIFEVSGNDLDWWSIYRGFDRYYSGRGLWSPHRDATALQRAWCLELPMPIVSIAGSSLVPLTVADGAVTEPVPDSTV